MSISRTPGANADKVDIKRIVNNAAKVIIDENYSHSLEVKRYADNVFERLLSALQEVENLEVSLPNYDQKGYQLLSQLDNMQELSPKSGVPVKQLISFGETIKMSENDVRVFLHSRKKEGVVEANGGGYYKISELGRSYILKYFESHEPTDIDSKN